MKIKEKRNGLPTHKNIFLSIYLSLFHRVNYLSYTDVSYILQSLTQVALVLCTQRLNRKDYISSNFHLNDVIPLTTSVTGC